jgi:hypothetical protein
MKNDIEHVFIYLQPLSISLSSDNCENETLFMAENHLQVDGPRFALAKNKRPPMRVRDLVKINKEYKVYNDIINFYNFLYEIELKT